ncbi:hypothetical protein BRC95_08930 [Halobacteriales archaeon QS_5_68_33]|nr:MAG: hypothetical protein BRC95_08930 [Halobacteriales archaeon QS_5_68_33]
MRRRELLASVGATALAAQTGCLAEGTDGGATTPENGTDTDTPTPGDRGVQPTVRDHSVETVGTTCSSGESSGIDVTFDETAVGIDGVARTSNPCYEATVESAADCVGAVTYAATVDLDTTEGVDTVVVTHSQERAGDDETFRARRDTEASPSPTDGPGTTPITHASSQPDPDLPVSLDNRHDERHEIGVEITRESGGTVHDETHTIDPGIERTVYNLREASPDGVETFEITATMGDATESVEVETSACYGDAIVSVTEDGELYLYYSIC